MSKEEIIDLLKNYKQIMAKRDLNLSEIDKLSRDIKRAEGDYSTSITPTYQEGSKSNQTSSKIENLVVNKEQKIIQWRERIKQLEEENEDLNYKLKQVDVRLGSLNRLEKEIIADYYINAMDYKTIGIETYWKIINQTRSEKTVARKIEEIMQKMLKL